MQMAKKISAVPLKRRLTFNGLHGIISQKIDKGKAIPVTGREGP
jgi:hypothetical protein